MPYRLLKNKITRAEMMLAEKIICVYPSNAPHIRTITTITPSKDDEVSYVETYTENTRTKEITKPISHPMSNDELKDSINGLLTSPFKRYIKVYYYYNESLKGRKTRKPATRRPAKK